MKTHKVLNLVMAFVFAFSLVGMPAAVSAQEPQPNPTLGVNPDGVWGIDWILGTSVTLTVDDPANGTGVDYTATETVQMYDFPKPTAVFHLPSNFEIQPGFELTMTDGMTTKTHTAVYFQISNVDVAADIVSGVTEAGSQVQVWMSKGARTVTAGSDGIWGADFKIPGDPPNEDDIVDILPGDFLMASVHDVDGDSTGDWANAPGPYLSARIPDNAVSGRDWTLGESVTLTIDDPETSQVIDYSETRTVVPWDWDPSQTEARFNLNNFLLQPGQVLTMTNGTVTKVHTIIDLKITDVNIDTDTVSGTTNVLEGEIEIYSFGNPPTNRIINVNSDGTWLADFSVPHSSQNNISDLRPGDVSEALHYDEDGDFTLARWIVPEPPNFNVRPNQNEIHAFRWPEGNLVHVTVDDPTTPNPVDYEETQEAVMTEWFNDMTFMIFRVEGMTLQVGQIVTMTDGATTKTHVIQELSVTGTNPVTNIVEGSAAPNAFIHVWESCDQDVCAFRYVQADNNGAWLADFSIPGSNSSPEEQKTLDLQPGSNGNANIRDEDGDFTTWDWRVLEPRIYIEPNEDNIFAWDWPVGTLLTLTIDDPATPDQTPDYTTTQVSAGFEDWDHGFELGGIFDIQPGYLVTVSDGNITKQHTVTHLTITNIDIDADTISGTANPDSFVHVGTMCDEDGCANRNLIVDATGNWLVDFSTPVNESWQGMGTFDLRLGSGGSVFEHDEDWDSTKVNWNVYNPTIGVDVDIDRVQGWDWPLGATVSFEIDDPLTTENPDYINSVTVETADWDPNLMYFVFYTNEYDVKPGDIVTATDGNLTKQLIVTHFRITSVDLALDTVYGVADPSQEVRVWTYNPYAHDGKSINRGVIADSNGNWFANFGIPGDEDSEQETVDIRNGWGFDSFVGDEDWDETRSRWEVPNPTIEVRANYDQVGTYIWDMGDTLTLEIDNPTTIDNPDYTATKTVTDVADWDPSQTYVPFDLSSVYDIQTGDMVSISNGAITKETIVTNLAITDVHLDTDIVEGIAEPNQTINMWTCSQNTCVNRDETADQNGNWSTNFAIPGEQDWEQDTLDVRPGSWIDSTVEDEDRDSTMFGWSEPNLTFVARANYDQIEAWAWPMGDTLSLSIDDPDSLDNPDYATTQVVTGTSEGDPRTYVLFDLSGLYDIQVGDTVSIGNGTFTKTTIVTNLAITNVYPGTDIVEGAAEPNQIINVWTCWQNTCVNRDETADQSGHWTANFAIPGEKDWEQGTLDIRSGSWIDSSVEDEDGDSTMFGWNVSSAPIADAGPDQTALEADTIMLDASASSDPESGLLIYEWDLDADGEYDDATGVTTNKIFPDNGNFTVGLKVTNQYDETDTDTAEITVANISPAVVIQQASANNLGILTGSGLFTDPGADTWTASVNYGDGTVTQSLALNPDKSFSLSYTYSASGDYTIEVCVSDDDEGSGCDQLQVTVVTNQPPIADAGGPYSGNEGTTINLSASKSTDPDNSIVLYEWDLDNDGQFDDATGKKPKFKAIDNGVFTVRVRVTDAGGLSSVDDATVTVKNVPPVIKSVLINSPTRVGVAVNASATFKDAGVIDTFTAIWKWGDGKTSNGVVSGTTVNGSHIYTKPGIYLVTITVKDKDDGIGQAYKLIVVLPKK